MSLPSHKGKSREGGEKYYNDVFIKDEDMFKVISEAVLGKFSELTNAQKDEQPQEDSSDCFWDS